MKQPLELWRSADSVTASDAARVLRCSPTTVVRMIRDGRLQGSQDGAHGWRVPTDGLAAIVDGQPSLPDATP